MIPGMAELELKAAIWAFVGREQSVSFAELEREFPEHFDHPDRVAITLEPYENVILWSGTSTELASSIVELAQASLIVTKAVSAFIYSIDGAMLRLPLARFLRSYKHPRWLPVIFHTPEHLASEAKF
jgi:hypothetical protein